MYVYNTTKVHSIIFIFCICLSLISPPYNQGIVQAKSEEKTASWMENKLYAPVQSSGKTNPEKDRKQVKYSDESKWKSSILNKNTECWVDCKIEHLKDIGIIPEIAESLVQNCKNIADDPRKCVLVWASIVIAESGGWKNCRKNNKWNCFGIMQDNKYKSYSDATLHFSWKFQKWWRNAKSMEFFYPPAWQVSKSRFCTSEHSSNSSIGCPNWLKNSSTVFKKLEKLF